MTIGVAVLGYGYWGANLARNVVAARSTELVAIVDPDPGRRAAAEQAHDGITALPSLEGALARPDVEAVIVSSPASTHATAASSVLRAGRHVLVEKPLAMDPDEALEVVDLAAKVDRTLMVGHTFMYSPPVSVLKEKLDLGELGAIQYLYSQRLSLGRIRRDCNALWNFAPHDVSIMLYLLGEHVVEVSARGLSFIQSGIDDVCFASLTFESGIGANLHVSWIDPRKTRLVTVVGDQKMAIYNDVSADQKLWIVDAGVARAAGGFGEYESLGDFQWRTRAGDIVIPQIPMVEPLRAEIEAFGDACATGVRPIADGEQGLEVVRVLHAIDRSVAAHGAPVTVTR